MRTSLSALLMIVAGLLLPVQPAGAATSTADVRPAVAGDPLFPFCWFPGGSGWTRVPDQFLSCAQCREVGEAGVRRGDWPDYRCGYFPVGLDVVYVLYLPTTV